jgi:hypothetical protein
VLPPFSLEYGKQYSSYGLSAGAGPTSTPDTVPSFLGIIKVGAAGKQKRSLDIVVQQLLMQQIDTIKWMTIQVLECWIQCTETFVRQGLQCTCKKNKNQQPNNHKFFSSLKVRHIMHKQTQPMPDHLHTCNPDNLIQPHTL